MRSKPPLDEQTALGLRSMRHNDDRLEQNYKRSKSGSDEENKTNVHDATSKRRISTNTNESILCITVSQELKGSLQGQQKSLRSIFSSIGIKQT